MRQLVRTQRQLDGPHRQLGGITKNMLLKTRITVMIFHSTVNRPLVSQFFDRKNVKSSPFLSLQPFFISNKS